MTTIPVNETVPGRAGTPRSPHQLDASPTASPAASPTASPVSQMVDRVRATMLSIQGVLRALLDLGRLHARSAWAEIRATSPSWFPVMFLAWCGAAAVLATAFAIWVLVVMITTG